MIIQGVTEFFCNGDLVAYTNSKDEAIKDINYMTHKGIEFSRSIELGWIHIFG